MNERDVTLTKNEKLDLLLADMQTIKTEMQTAKIEMLPIKLTLENETNSNVKVIAEGHSDISRKLDEVLKAENKKKLLLIRMNSLENEIGLIKEGISQIA